MYDFKNKDLCEKGNSYSYHSYYKNDNSKKYSKNKTNCKNKNPCEYRPRYVVLLVCLCTLTFIGFYDSAFMHTKLLSPCLKKSVLYDFSLNHG